MSLDEKIRELDGQIASRVKQWLREQHELLGRKLGEEITRQLDEAGDFLPESLISADVRAELEAAVAPEISPPVTSYSALREAIVGVDEARTQATALAALLAEGRRFASRLAVFLIRSGEAIGWKSRGFGEAGGALESLSVTFRDGGPWDRLAKGRASVRMSAVDCARLSSRIESPTPKQGLLIPLVLRDQVAAAVYADQLGEDKPLDEDALQLLTYAAAQAIETLPFRDRSVTTPTLVFESGAGGDSGGLSLWGAGDAAATAAVAAQEAPAEPEGEAEAPAEEELPVAAAEEEEEEDDETQVEGAALDSEEAPGDEEEVPGEPEEVSVAGEEEPAVVSDTRDVGPILEEVLEAEPEEAAPEPEAADESIEEPPVADLADYGLEDLEPPETHEAVETFAAPVELEAPEADAEPEADPAIETVAGPDALSWQEDVEVVEEPQLVDAAAQEEVEVWEAEPEATAIAEEELGDLPVVEAQAPEPEPEAPEPEMPDPATLETVEPAADGLQTLHYPVPTIPEEEVEAVPAAEPSPEAATEVDVEGYAEPDDTILLNRPPALEAPVAPAPEEEPFDGDETHPGVGSPAPDDEPPAAPAARASEVAPPSDIDGPGFAFANRAQPAAGDEEMHEKAKRLARLLVSEIKLYNEEQVEEGQRNNDIYERLKEDIDRSRQMYEDRVDERVRSTNDYFYQELVRTLASGDPQALGI